MIKNTGDSNRITRDYFDSILLEERLIDAEKADTEYELYGKTFKTPVMTAALSHLENVYPNGMAEMAKGALDAGAVAWCGMGDDKTLESMIATGASVIKIVKPYAENEKVIGKLKKAEELGAFAVGMDIDHAFSRDGEYDVVLGEAMKPKTLQEMKNFVEATALPFIVKGVLSVRDALKCLEIGVSGIVVSHHHGAMDYAVPPLRILPEIVKAVGGKLLIFVDCGVESGMDAYKCLALGADAVSAGRIIMGPLEEKGAKGVEESLTSITAQLKSAMAKTGMRTINDIDSSVLWTLNGRYE